MREEEIKRLVKIVEESDIEEIEISRWGSTIKITKHAARNSTHSIPPPTSVPPVPIGSQPETKAELKSVEATGDAKSPPGTGNEIKSPMVGTFYGAPAPDADPYVDVGHIVKKGQVLCIIEAMKLMNEIESEVDGRIVEILVDNAQPVEYNQPLFLIEPA